MTLQLLVALKGAPGSFTDISISVFFQFWLRSRIWRPYRTPIDLILVSLERYGCLGSRTLEKRRSENPMVRSKFMAL